MGQRANHISGVWVYVQRAVVCPSGKEGLHSKYLPVYCSSKVGAFLSETEPWKQLRDNHNVQLRVFSSPLKEETIGNFSVVPVLVPHRSELSDTLAFKFRPHPPRQDVNGKEGTFYCPDTDGSSFILSLESFAFEILLPLLDKRTIPKASYLRNPC